jgi:hypothetical protein
MELLGFAFAILGQDEFLFIKPTHSNICSGSGGNVIWGDDGIPVWEKLRYWDVFNNASGMVPDGSSLSVRMDESETGSREHSNAIKVQAHRRNAFCCRCFREES